MYKIATLLSLGSALIGASAQSIPASSGIIPPAPMSTNGIPLVEGALTYDGPPVIGFTGPGGNATVQTGNPPTSYTATLPMKMFDNSSGAMITGSITGSAAANGSGVSFVVSFMGLPNVATYGPFVYHIHALPVPSDGNCTGTLGHLDPTIRGELHACEVMAPQTCQAGDLAGKHGNITMTNFTASYSDLYLSTNASSAYFFGDKSIVIHTNNATRLTCANFTMNSSGLMPTVSGTTSAPISSPSIFTGAASQLNVFGGTGKSGAIGLGFLATLWLLF